MNAKSEFNHLNFKKMSEPREIRSWSACRNMQIHMKLSLCSSPVFSPLRLARKAHYDGTFADEQRSRESSAEIRWQKRYLVSADFLERSVTVEARTQRSQTSDWQHRNWWVRCCESFVHVTLTMRSETSFVRAIAREKISKRRGMFIGMGRQLIWYMYNILVLTPTFMNF